MDRAAEEAVGVAALSCDSREDKAELLIAESWYGLGKVC